MTSAFVGTIPLVRLALRTGWKGLVGWIVGLVGLFAVTARSMAGLYPTPEKIGTYAASVGDSMVIVNGRVAGLGTLGGIVVNEFSFVSSLAVPILALALVTRGTRTEEETGRLELLLAGRTGRLAPLGAAVTVSGLAVIAVAGGIWASTLGLDVDRTGALYYCASVVALGCVFVSVTALVAQVVGNVRTVWSVGLPLVGAALVLRGVGDSRGSWIAWLSPLGWQGRVRPFGDPDPWPLALSAVVALVLAVAAAGVAARRDVGQGLFASRPGPTRASRLLASPTGVILHQHRVTLLGWTAGVVVVLAVYGGLSKVVLDTIAGNPDLARFVGDPHDVLDSVVRMITGFVGFLGAGFALQSWGSMHGEETSARLESALAAGRSRWAWLATQVVVVGLGAVLVVVAGSISYGLSTSAALDGSIPAGRVIAAGLWQIPAVLAVSTVSVALFGVAPRWQSLAWAPFALAVVVSFMGPALQLTRDQVRWSPFSAIGEVPGGAVDVGAVVVLAVTAAVLATVGLVAFRRRDVPRT